MSTDSDYSSRRLVNRIRHRISLQNRALNALTCVTLVALLAWYPLQSRIHTPVHRTLSTPTATTADVQDALNARYMTRPAARGTPRPAPIVTPGVTSPPTSAPIVKPTPSPRPTRIPRPPAPSVTSAAAAPVSGVKGTALQMVLARGWGPAQFTCLDLLWMRESGWNYRATNPSSGAYGIPQSLPASKMASAGADWRTNPITQISWGLSYIASVYGTPCGAWAHSQATGWY